jgi:rhamnose utilization protein RhaD (predicted bifunctional aldolase and dehydrogenase)
MRPGFVLEIQRCCQAKPQMKGLEPGRHGLVKWADDDRQCYRLTVRIIQQAADFIETRGKGVTTFGSRYQPPEPAQCGGI